MHKMLREAFDTLEATRNQFFSSPVFNGDIHTRVLKDKWSIAESIYHCYKLVKISRIGIQIYLPVARPFTHLRTNYNENSDMPNIYAGKTMPAPFILVPGDVSHLSKGDLRLLLEAETTKIQNLVEDLTKKEMYSIRLPDPVPNYPNIIQSVKLLEIHERHHYEIVSK